MTKAIYHLHTRKRMSKKKEPYPSDNFWKKILDVLVYVVGILGPIFTIPQILKIWLEKSAQGISSITWVAYLFGAIILLIYGIVHKEKPLIIMYVLWIIIYVILIVGIIIYGG